VQRDWTGRKKNNLCIVLGGKMSRNVAKVTKICPGLTLP